MLTPMGAGGPDRTGKFPRLSRAAMAALLFLGAPLAAPIAVIDEAGAVCVGGANIVCDGVDADGAAQAGDGTTVTVNPGATVDNPAGVGVALTGDGDDAVVLNNGAISGQGGLQLGDDGQITNNGSITSNGAQAAILGVDRVTITNSDTIDGTSQQAIILGDNAVVINYGTVNSDGAEGIELDDNGAIYNFGLIQSDDEEGIQMNAGTVVNAGSIIATDNDTALEFDPGPGVASLINSGVIAGQEGVISDAQITIQNSGLIVGELNEALALSAADDVLIMLPGGQVQGLADFNGGTDTVIFDGPQNVALLVQDLEVVLSSDSTVFADLAAGTVVSVDATAIAGQEEAFADLIGGILGASGRRFGSLRETDIGSPTAAAAPTVGVQQSSFTIANDAAYDSSVWAEGFGGFRTRGEEGARSESDTVYVGGLVGHGFDALGGRADIFAGGSFSSFDTIDDAAGGFGQEIEAQSGFVGGQIAYEVGSITLGGALVVGASDFQSERVISNAGALETAEASYTGAFVSPELRAVGDYDVGRARVQPSLALGYAGLFTSDYTESGSSSNLSVDSQTNHVFRGRAQIAIPVRLVATEDGGIGVTPRIGVEGIGFVGDDASASLLGVTQSLDDGSDDALVRGLVGAQATLFDVGGAEAMADVEGGYDSDDGRSVEGRLLVRFNF